MLREVRLHPRQRRDARRALLERRLRGLEEESSWRRHLCSAWPTRVRASGSTTSRATSSTSGELARMMERRRRRRRHLEPDDLPEGDLRRVTPTTSSSEPMLAETTTRRRSSSRSRPATSATRATSSARVWDEGARRDGYVSMEVDPRLAYDTEATVVEAVRLHALIDRPNLLVKIPATKPGLPAIEEMIAKGKSINVTLIFSLERYREVAEAYIRGLERLVAGGERPGPVASVASFFVSRVDTEADRRLDEIGRSRSPEGQARDRERQARLPASTSSCSRASAGTFLASKGATPQRCLWASTSTKNPAYRDVMYVEELIGPDTVDTMPEETIEAFQDHGEVARTLDRGVEDARAPPRRAGGGRDRLRRRHGDARTRRRREVRRLVRRAARGHPRLEPGARRGIARRRP